MAKASSKIELSVMIHDTPAALRFGGDGYFVTFAGTELDKDKAMALAALTKTSLKLSIEIDASEISKQKKTWP